MLEKYRNVTVTGGLGFIGSHLVGELQSLGKNVTIIDSLWTSEDKIIAKGARFVEADIRDREKIAEPIEDADLVFHVAANSNGTVSVVNPRMDHEMNDVGTFNVMEAASNGGAGRVLYVSSASVYGIPQSFPMHETDPKEPFVPYGSSKYRGELKAISFHNSRGLDVIIPRPFCFYGRSWWLIRDTRRACSIWVVLGAMIWVAVVLPPRPWPRNRVCHVYAACRLAGAGSADRGGDCRQVPG